MRLSSPPKPQAPRGPASRARLDAGGEGERAPKAPRHILPASSAASQVATSGSIYTRGAGEVTPCRAQLRPPCTAAARPDSRPPPAPAAPRDRTRRPAGPAGPGSASRPARRGGPRGAAGPQAWAAARPYRPRARRPAPPAARAALTCFLELAGHFRAAPEAEAAAHGARARPLRGHRPARPPLASAVARRASDPRRHGGLRGPRPVRSASGAPARPGPPLPPPAAAAPPPPLRLPPLPPLPRAP